MLAPMTKIALPSCDIVFSFSFYLHFARQQYNISSYIVSFLHWKCVISVEKTPASASGENGLRMSALLGFPATGGSAWEYETV